MNKKVLVNFLQDHILFAFMYFISSLLIALFYRISTGTDVEWAYPLLISAFIFAVFIFIRWFQYYPFNLRIQKSTEDFYHDLSPLTREQKETTSVIEKIYQRSMEKTNIIQIDNKNRLHFMTQWIHNMKTPISVVALVIQKTQRGEMSPDKALTDIKEENERLLSLMEQTLQFIRLEDFPKDYLPEKLDLNASLKRAINTRKNQFIYNNVFPRIESADEPVYVFSDAKWNEVVLEQLISNAIKYSGNQQLSKNVYFNIEKTRDHVLLKIRDEGIGIPEYDIPRVFEAFFTGDNGRNYRNSTGIGLYICKVVTEKLGHKINLQSKVGQGTEVTIEYLAKM
jgi:two-component system, OmpR family, sensor histidine kinase YxdK